MLRLGVIGLGNRVVGTIVHLPKITDDCLVTAVADINEEFALKRIKENAHLYAPNIKIYCDADEMLAKEELDGVIVGTRCRLHTSMALKVIEKGIPLFLEKPVAITVEDVRRLYQAQVQYHPKVMVSFPLRFSMHANLVKEIIDSGKIGTVEHVQAFNDVPYGRVYFHDWYRDENETAGLWLQKATHDFDCLNYILGEPAEEICAMSVKNIFKGDMPAGLKCKDCEKFETCPEGPYAIEHIYKDSVIGEYCCFAEDTGNEDCGSALIRYNSGAIAAYSQNFFARHKAGRRGARIYGYKGTLEFDWYQPQINVYMHTSPRVDSYTLDMKSDNHFGGDFVLVQKFVAMMKGKCDESYLEEGMTSALMCLMAKESCRKNEFISIQSLSKL